MHSTTLYRAPDEDWAPTTYKIARRFGFFRPELAPMTWLRFIYDDKGNIVAVTGGTDDKDS